MPRSSGSKAFSAIEPMAQVTISLNGRNHVIACDDGQEQHLQFLAEEIDARIAETAASSEIRLGDPLLMVLASLLIADELRDAQNEIERLHGAIDGGAEGAVVGMVKLAERIEGIARGLEAA